MNFEELKSIWDTQKQEYVFTLEQPALHNLVLQKQTKGLHIINASEWLMIVVNMVVPVFIIATLRGDFTNLSMIILSGWMLLTAAYIVYCRYRRIQGQARFDRSLHGDLQFAIDVARHQVRLSALGRWNIIPIGILSVTGLMEADKSLWIAAAVVVFLLLSNYAAGWEANLYKMRLRELEALKKKLEEAV